MGELKKLELKIRNKDEEINQLTQELETSSEAVNFAEKLTLDILKKEEELKETTKKLNEYINRVESLENDLSLNK
jgi:predicted RNase H-like nuclease (RuvC/YqgF family)